MHQAVLVLWFASNLERGLSPAGEKLHSGVCAGDSFKVLHAVFLRRRKVRVQQFKARCKRQYIMCHSSRVDLRVHASKGKGILFNAGGQTGKDCLLTWADGVKVADRRDRTCNLSLRKRCTNHCTTGPHTSAVEETKGTTIFFISFDHALKN